MQYEGIVPVLVGHRVVGSSNLVMVWRAKRYASAYRTVSGAYMCCAVNAPVTVCRRPHSCVTHAYAMQALAAVHC